MYIISDLNGNLVQRSNAEITDLQVLIDKFTNELEIEIIGTTDEGLYLKTTKTGYFDIVVENGAIVDVLPKDKPMEEINIELTLGERLTIAEDTINFLLGL